MESRQVDIRELSLEQIASALAQWGEKSFRAKQIWEWLWTKPERTFEAMSNLPKSLRDKLAAEYSYHTLSVAHEQRSNDGSIKFGFELSKGGIVEGVLIPQQHRTTACISSQVGCSLSCKFCATGYMKLQRNLEHFEIFDQVAYLNAMSEKEYARPLSNIVYMGMGEPLLNYRNVMNSIERITAPDGLHMSPRRITVSTAGIAKMIKKLADDAFSSEFALSLHAANDNKRSEMMPINDTNSLEALADALRYFFQKTQTRVTLEYIIFHDFNDSLQDAAELARFARCVPCKINVIEYNPIQEANFRNTTEARMQQFIGYLESQKMIVNVRRSRGKDVDGGCGQLSLKTGAPLKNEAPAPELILW